MKLLKAAEILIDKIKKDYKNDIACVVVMGSYVYNETHSRSDLDMYFVPKTERGFNLQKVFLIDGIGFDFWAISWERLEGMANHDERITSIITEGKMLYYGSEEDLNRFNEIKAKALHVSDVEKFIGKAKEQVDTTYKKYFKLLNAGNISDARKHAMGIIFSLTYAIALLNRTTVKRGRGKLKKEIMDMELVPKDFATLYDTVFISNDIDMIRKAYGQLIRNTEDLIQMEHEKISKPVSFKDNVSGYYEEMINFYNKIYHSCEIGDKYTALFATTELTMEFEGAFSVTEVSANELPDIIGAYAPENIDTLLQLVHEHQRKIEGLLENHGVEVTVFKDFQELEEYMKSL
ncbi:hypothetical protein HYG86_04475 [Alkalicella caledoniensis]|uniref:Polymerase beta nucleotidyltransferase domain-containing protein n=1 Tax=Alkalicella caledoniensis TaxID=2731377 RepID=A0A7G9W5W7_ALKCA|nr:hypothetical protein [Alkalicella caledoniensis]QNO14079.1 hypothetical protein HYG86_04475 [Alkalicella caledoniensis]